MNLDIEAIEEVVRDAEELQSDVSGFAGIRLRGRERVRKVLAKALHTPLKDVLTKNELLDVTFLRPGAALANLIKHVHDGRTGAPTFAPAQTTPVVTA
jgi:phage terminase Nu1 subunit (DNA packaging protein)